LNILSVASRITMSSPAYRATLLPIRWAQVKTALTVLHFGCTSCYITCRRFECFYRESMGKYGQFYGKNVLRKRRLLRV
jgi:hypothetical protein